MNLLLLQPKNNVRVYRRFSPQAEVFIRTDFWFLMSVTSQSVAPVILIPVPALRDSYCLSFESASLVWLSFSHFDIVAVCYMILVARVMRNSCVIFVKKHNELMYGRASMQHLILKRVVAVTHCLCLCKLWLSALGDCSCCTNCRPTKIQLPPYADQDLTAIDLTLSLECVDVLWLQSDTYVSRGLQLHPQPPTK